MSVLTKVFVVLVTFLSVALVAATVPFVATTEKYRDLFEREQSARQIAQATAAQRQTQLTEERNEKQVEIDQLSNKIKDLERQSSSLVATQNQLRAQSTEKGYEIDKLRAQETQLTAANRNLTATALAQARELSEHRSQMRAHVEQVVGLELRVAELDNENQFLQQRLRFYQEQVEALQQGKQGLHDTLRQIPRHVMKDYVDPDGTANVVSPPHDIEGQVTEVRRKAGVTWVGVNVGRTDGVLEQMQFLVQRGDQYVGTLIITIVQERAAAGSMNLLAPGHEVIVGDVVSAHPPN